VGGEGKVTGTLQNERKLRVIINLRKTDYKRVHVK